MIARRSACTQEEGFLAVAGEREQHPNLAGFSPSKNLVTNASAGSHYDSINVIGSGRFMTPNSPISVSSHSYYVITILYQGRWIPIDFIWDEAHLFDVG
jgi:hypothetical protein